VWFLRGDDNDDDDNREGVGGDVSVSSEADRTTRRTYR
jgi:hypothetical protein